MISLAKELFALLTPDQRRSYLSLQVMMMLMAFMEMLGIASIGPFMALVADMQLLETNAVLNKLYLASGVSTHTDFLFITGFVVLLTLGFASILSIFTTWRLSLFAFSVGTEFSDRLYRYYLQKDWLFHASGSSAQLTKQISTEAYRVTNSIILPFIEMNARIVLALFISVSIFIYNPMIASIGIILFTSGYILIYKVIRNRIALYGENISTTSTDRFRLMNEGFGGIKDLLLYNRSSEFVHQFEQSGKVFARAQGVNTALSYAPRYLMELLAFGSMISLILVLLITRDGNLSQVLPVLGIYALAGFKLLPALQQTYYSITTIRGNTAAFDSIKKDLLASLLVDNEQGANSAIKNQRVIDLANFRNIRLNNVSFTYPDKEMPALIDINIDIPINSTVGFVGESGSGKSTTIDLILGLISPSAGQLMLDDLVIEGENLQVWQKNIGFVPQSIFLSEGSITENVAFGLCSEDTDLEKVKQAIKLAHLEPLVNSLPKGLDTKVGERGVQLSGGQRQRIGIARALYNQADVLVFDEATSALDGITEKVIMDSIQELSGQKTIVMIAHRLKTVKNCDVIYLMEQGRVIEQGTYQQLIDNNSMFKKMARFS
ncbi:MAG TPA: ABC transporter ATP-binding protein [Psychrobacter sp.]|uniref:ABC transporter ATP-binding protein n=1 Tax=Psychrobacter sp. TaxID=56811 RepID=UPI002CDBBF13|nr:ABC transporter ATP-binding protein [Psychrobacter sp.]HSP86317.1 ABC transporter ATP-binding protein [Psychrobacter sp.]